MPEDIDTDAPELMKFPMYENNPEFNPELKNLLAAVHNATIGITMTLCPMYNAVTNHFPHGFCVGICLFGDGQKCKIRTLKSAYQNYLTSAGLSAVICNSANPDQPENKTDPTDAPDYLEILEESI